MESILTFFASFERKDIATLGVASYAAIVATLNFAWPMLKDRREARTAVFRALQGEKEAISEVAMQVVEGKWDANFLQSEMFRARLVKALSMAFVLESSDRAKAYVVAAFDHISKIGFRNDLLAQLTKIQIISKGNFQMIVPYGTGDLK